MARIEILTNNWDRDNKERIDRNFANLGKLDLDIMDDFLHTDPSQLTPRINGLSRPSTPDLRTLNDFGINVTAEVNGVIHRAWVYVNKTGGVGFGIAEQERNGVAKAIIRYITLNLKQGWNHVILNFPVEQNKSYTLFKRNVDETVLINTASILGWADYPFKRNGLDFNAGKFLNETSTYTNYGPFFEIELITSLAQIYKISGDSVKPSQQFYVGDNPPSDAQFWFKPLGGA